MLIQEKVHTLHIIGVPNVRIGELESHLDVLNVIIEQGLVRGIRNDKNVDMCLWYL